MFLSKFLSRNLVTYPSIISMMAMLDKLKERILAGNEIEGNDGLFARIQIFKKMLARYSKYMQPKADGSENRTANSENTIRFQGAT